VDIQLLQEELQHALYPGHSHVIPVLLQAASMLDTTHIMHNIAASENSHSRAEINCSTNQTDQLEQQEFIAAVSLWLLCGCTCVQNHLCHPTQNKRAVWRQADFHILLSPTSVQLLSPTAVQDNAQDNPSRYSKLPTLRCSIQSCTLPAASPVLCPEEAA
jgi:hypothetical protein